MRIFIAVVESQGFSSASRNLGIPVPTVCRKIAHLEDRLGAQLLLRTTRKVTVTDNGQRYYEDVRRILEDLNTAERHVAGEFRRIKGLLNVTAPSMFGRLHMLPVVHEFMRLNSDIEVRLLYTNHMLDLLDEHIDLGVRIGKQAKKALEAIHIADMRQVVCASPAYLAGSGPLEKPGDLVGHETITFSRSCSQIPWLFDFPEGSAQEVMIRSKLIVNTAEAAIDSAIQGFGVTQLYYYQAASSIASGELQVVLEQFEIEPDPVNLIIPQGVEGPQKVKAFTEYAVPALRQRLQQMYQNK